MQWAGRHKSLYAVSVVLAVLNVLFKLIPYSSLEQAGSYSALLRMIDICIDKAQKILDLDTMDVDGGNIRLGGIIVREYSMDSLIKNFSFVFQNVYLFADTIANNIAFGRENATREEIVTAAKKACCHDFIMSLPDGYDTVIGEGGASISGGEKQRISIARAIMKNAPIIILDEATANVDPENEKELVEAIDALTKEKTIIMIAHRLKTVLNADQIVVVDSGKIAQLGIHTQLMQEGGIYKNFVNTRQQAAGWKINA